jgi:3'-phosphoadenosine 5'-phosphosulfate sulfotransferase (PAPS reductase)/FAD synthetase
MSIVTATAAAIAAELGVAIDHQTLDDIVNGAIFAFSLSGGKDSGYSAHIANRLLDLLGHPRDRRIAIHSDLGRIEWDVTLPTIEQLTDILGVPLMVVRHNKHDMISRWEARFSEGKRRYEGLEVFNLIGPWSSANLRFCTAEMKQQVISRALQKAFPGQRIVSVVGIRREESLSRSTAPISQDELRWSKADGTTLRTWHPALFATVGEVFSYHEQHRIPLHLAYDLNSSRLGCSFCVLQQLADQVASNRHQANHGTYRQLVGGEAYSTFSFQPTRWLADVTPALLSPELAERIVQAKIRAKERRSLEAALPRELRYVAGWPIRAPDLGEAEHIAETRAVILGHHGLQNLFPTAETVINRFNELLEAKAAGKSKPLVKRAATSLITA